MEETELNLTETEARIAVALKAFKEMTSMICYLFLGATKIAMLADQEFNYRRQAGESLTQSKKILAVGNSLKNK